MIGVFALISQVSGQNQSVVSSLKSKFSQVQYHPECGGWYFLSYSNNGQTLYGFADSQGNVIASEAYKYKQHKGFIELYILDKQKAAEHEQWKRDYQQYQADYAKYKRISAEYDAALNVYNANVTAAKTEAERRYNAARQAAIKRAEAENARLAQQNSGGVLGGILGGLSAGLNTATAASSVKFEPFFEQVKGERGLISPPSKPYNPIPNEPKEPADGYEWKNFCLLHPCPYSYIEFEKIKEIGNFAKVTKDGKHGLVDAYMNEVVPCVSSKPVTTTWDDDNICRVSTSNGHGIIDSKGKFIVPIQYATMEKAGKNYIVSQNGKSGLINASGKIVIPLRFSKINHSKTGEFYCKDNNGWGLYTSSFEELYPCQFQNIGLGTINGRRCLKIQKNGLWGILDYNTGSSLLPVRYEEINLFKVSDKESAFLVKKDGKSGLYSDRGVNILPLKMDSIEMDGNNFKVKDNKTLGLYSSDGFEIIPLGKYTEYKQIIPGMYDVTDNAKAHGVYLCSGQEIVPCLYSSLEMKKKEDVLFFKASKASGTKGIVSMTGQELFPFIPVWDFEIYNDFLLARNFDNKYNLRYGCYDFDGMTIIPPTKSKKSLYKKISKLNQKKHAASYSASTTKKEMLKAASNNVTIALKEHFLKASSFSYFAQNYVERLINEWQIRGEYEKKEAYVNRVNQQTRQQKVYELTREAQTAYVNKISRTLPEDKMSIVGQYDADNETYRIHSDYSTVDLLVHVSPEDAQNFKTYFAQSTKKPVFFVDNDYLGIAEYKFTLPSGQSFQYSNQASLNYTVANVDYNFDEIVIDSSSSNFNAPKGKQTISSSALNIGTSDVDVAIPRALTEQPDTYALIIANELYSNEKNVEFAFNDGQIFREYCIRALGIPEKNVQFRANATLNDMRFDINWLKQMANVNNGNAKFIVYYAGHGMPDDGMKDSYLLPVDGYSSDANSGYKLSEFYATLSNLPAENVTVYLDACFSGSQRNGEVMSSVRGVAITPYVTKPKGNLMVFAATSGKETAQPYAEKKHGLFTYFLLKKLKEHQGELYFGELEKYVSAQVQKVALTNPGRKSQTPNVTASEAMSNWEQIRIR